MCVLTLYMWDSCKTFFLNLEIWRPLLIVICLYFTLQLALMNSNITLPLYSPTVQIFIKRSQVKGKPIISYIRIYVYDVHTYIHTPISLLLQIEQRKMQLNLLTISQDLAILVSIYMPNQLKKNFMHKIRNQVWETKLNVIDHSYKTFYIVKLFSVQLLNDYLTKRV